MDNHFSGSHVDILLGENGYKSINTCRRDCLPKGSKNVFHHIKAVEVNARLKMTKFEQPIVVVKEVKFPAASDKNHITLSTFLFSQLEVLILQL